MRQRIINGLKLLFTPLAFGFLLYFAWQSRAELNELLSTASFSYLLPAVLVWAMLHALSPVLAVVVFNSCGSKVSWQEAFSTHAARLPARYLPGGIWHTVGRVMDYREQGAQARHISAFVILENGLAAVVTLTVGGAIVFSMRGVDSLGSVAGLASLAGLIALPVMCYLINSRVLQHPHRMTFVTYLKSLSVVFLFWAGAAATFLLYLSAFPSSTGVYSFIEITGIYLFSWGIGFISVFAPQGIGVFEAIASELIESPIGFMGLAALIAGFRVVVLFADLLVWSVYLLTRRTS